MAECCVCPAGQGEGKSSCEVVSVPYWIMIAIIPIWNLYAYLKKSKAQSIKVTVSSDGAQIR